jgi:VWFA-related protein
MRLMAGTLIGLLALTVPGVARVQESQRPTFRGSVNMVAVTTVVRKRNGQAVTDLTPEDFELYDNGERRPIASFQSTSARVSLALLVDFSGSMDVAMRLGTARQTVEHLLGWLTPGTDEVGLFAFDSSLQELEPLGPAPGNVLKQLAHVRPFGATSLYDAVAGAGQALAAQSGPRRAIVVLTDGADNRSRLTPAQVGAIASAIDVPVYVFVVVSPFDLWGAGVVDDKTLDETLRGPLGDLARSTGGEIFAATRPAPTSAAARQIVNELRQEYLIAFAPGSQPGWHAIAVRTRHKDLIVRARSGYVVPSPSVFQ